MMVVFDSLRVLIVGLGILALPGVVHVTVRSIRGQDLTTNVPAVIAFGLFIIVGAGDQASRFGQGPTWRLPLLTAALFATTVATHQHFGPTRDRLLVKFIKCRIVRLKREQQDYPLAAKAGYDEVAGERPAPGSQPAAD